MIKFINSVIFLTIIYHCYFIGKSCQSKINSYSIKLSYIDIFNEKRSLNDKKLAPFNSILGIASSNVIAYSNGNDTYYSNKNNYLNGIFMGLKWQCVEYARRWTFFRKGSIFDGVKGASDMWDQLKFVERVFDNEIFPLKKHSNGSPNPPINESYLIYPIQRDMPFGHVAIIVDVLDNAIRIAEQNFNFHYWLYNYSREIPFVHRNGLYYIQDEYEVYGWIDIDDDQELKPLDKSVLAKFTKG